MTWNINNVINYMPKDKTEAKNMEEGSPEEEAMETPAQEQKEVEAGAGDSTVPISEEFQNQAQQLVESCSSKMELSFLRDLVMQKEDELRKVESDKETTMDDYNAVKLPVD